MSGWGTIKRDAADDAFSEWIRRRDGKCMKCGRFGTGAKGITGLQASHFIKRRAEPTRFDPLNADSLCATCHHFFEEHKTEYEVWKVEKEGQHIIDMLYVLAQTYKKKDRLSEKLYWRHRLKTEYN